MFSHHQTHPQLDRGFRLGPATFLDLFVTALHSSSVAYQIPSNLGDSSSRVISFCISYCSWGSWGNNTGVTCYSLLQPTTFRQNSPLWPICLAWPCMAWLIVSLLHKPLCHSRAVIQEGDLNIMPRQTLISTSYTWKSSEIDLDLAFSVMTISESRRGKLSLGCKKTKLSSFYV